MIPLRVLRGNGKPLCTLCIKQVIAMITVTGGGEQLAPLNNHRELRAKEGGWESGGKFESSEAGDIGKVCSFGLVSFCFPLPALFSFPQALARSALVLVSYHLGWDCHTPGLYYTQFYSYSEWLRYIERQTDRWRGIHSFHMFSEYLCC